MRQFIFATFLLATPVLAQDAAPLNFDIAKLCAWQLANNGMDVAECTKLEDEAKNTVAEREAAADAARKTECTEEARSYSGDSGFASFTVYAECLKSGPGNL